MNAIHVLMLGTSLLCGWGGSGAQARSPEERVSTETRTLERVVAFTGASGVELAGTLTLPGARRGARSAGLVLIAGSGPTDRDGNQPPAFKTDLLKQIAARLADRGVVTLRFDKRVTGANRSRLPAALGDFCRWENFVDDAIAALRCLQKQPEVDGDRTGFFGHSEGGMLALVAAEKIKADRHPVYALVLASTPGRPIDEVLHDQLARLLKQQGAPAEQTTFFLDKNTQICAALRSAPTVPADVPPGLAALFPAYLGQFLHGELLVSPADIAHRFAGPVLILQAEKDVQVLADKDASKLDAALRSRVRDSHTLAILPGASHNLKAVSSEADPGVEGPVKDEALRALDDWVKSQLRHSITESPRK